MIIVYEKIIHKFLLFCFNGFNWPISVYKKSFLSRLQFLFKSLIGLFILNRQTIPINDKSRQKEKVKEIQGMLLSLPIFRISYHILEIIASNISHLANIQSFLFIKSNGGSACLKSL